MIPAAIVAGFVIFVACLAAETLYDCFRIDRHANKTTSSVHLSGLAPFSRHRGRRGEGARHGSPSPRARSMCAHPAGRNR